MLVAIVLVIGLFALITVNRRLVGAYLAFALVALIALWAWRDWIVDFAVLSMGLVVFVLCVTYRPNPLERLVRRAAWDGMAPSEHELADMLQEATVGVSDADLKRFTRQNKEYAARLRREAKELQKRQAHAGRR